MVKYTIQRLILIALTLFIVVSISFFVLRSMPGNFMNNPMMSQTVKDAVNAKYHLDKPMIVQYGYFLKDFSRLDFGLSIKLQPRVPVNDILKTKVPVSMQLNIFSLILSLPIAAVLGIWAALRKNKMSDHAISVLIIVFISIPGFVIASLLQYLLAFKWGWFPIVSSVEKTLTWSKFVSIILPIAALSFGSIAGLARFIRSELIEALNSEYMLLAKAKGLRDVQATLRHAMRNAFIPLANIIIPMFTMIMGGSLVIERIFSIPGMGSIMVDAINAKDYPVALGVLFWFTLLGLVTSLIIDLSYGIIDPRIRMGGKK